MKAEQRSQQLRRRVVLVQLSDAEIANVCRAETAARVLEGDEYIDLEQLEHGVRRAREALDPLSRVLPRKAVAAGTWDDILTQLAEGQQQRRVRAVRRLGTVTQSFLASATTPLTRWVFRRPSTNARATASGRATQGLKPRGLIASASAVAVAAALAVGGKISAAAAGIGAILASLASAGVGSPARPALVHRHAVVPRYSR